jgi:hypothetical protein
MNKRDAVIAVLGLLLVNVVARSLPHAANFAPIAATGLFLGAYLGRGALPLTLLVLMISDYALLYVNPYGSPHLSSVYAPWRLLYGESQVFVYGSFAMSALVGQVLKTHRTPTPVVVASLFCSLQFFFITNAGVWIAGAYDRGIHGLYESYVAGIPFFRGTLSGDLVYSVAFFGLYEMVKVMRGEQRWRGTPIPEASREA